MQVEHGFSALMKGLRFVEMVRLLLHRGAKVDLKTDAGDTALSFAAAEGYLESLEELLHAGADPNSITRSGRTALMLASGNNHPEVVKLLLAAGADPLLKDKEQKSALDYATSVGADKGTTGLLLKRAQGSRP